MGRSRQRGHTDDDPHGADDPGGGESTDRRHREAEPGHAPVCLVRRLRQDRFAGMAFTSPSRSYDREVVTAGGAGDDAKGLGTFDPPGQTRRGGCAVGRPSVPDPYLAAIHAQQGGQRRPARPPTEHEGIAAGPSKRELPSVGGDHPIAMVDGSAAPVDPGAAFGSGPAMRRGDQQERGGDRGREADGAGHGPPLPIGARPDGPRGPRRRPCRR